MSGLRDAGLKLRHQLVLLERGCLLTRPPQPALGLEHPCGCLEDITIIGG